MQLFEAQFVARIGSLPRCLRNSEKQRKNSVTFFFHPLLYISHCGTRFLPSNSYYDENTNYEKSICILFQSVVAEKSKVESGTTETG